MKLVSFLLFSFLLEIYTERISIPQHVKRKLLKKSISSWHIVNSDNTKSLHQVVPFTERTGNNVCVGTPAQGFTVQLDTATKESWIFSAEYRYMDPSYLVVNRSHNRYNRNKSETYQEPDKTPYPKLFINTRNEWAFGFRKSDIFTVLDTKFNAQFYGIVMAKADVANDKYDGVMGLQYDLVQGNFIRELCKEKQKPEHEIDLFAIYYNRVYDTEMDSGVLDVCHIHTKKFKNNTMHWINEKEPGTWKIDVERAVLRTNSKTFKLTSQSTASLDSASNEILMPEKDLKLFYELSNELFTDIKKSEFNCERDKDFPNISLTIGGQEYTMTGFDYIYETQLGTQKNCKIILNTAPSTPNEWRLGEPFLRKFYTAFDMRNHRVGFAELIRSPVSIF